MKLTPRDLVFGAVNGAFVGVLAPYIYTNLGGKLHIHLLLFVFIMALGAAFGIAIGYALSKIRPFFFQLAKFGLIGVTNSVVDIGIYNSFIYYSNVSSGSMIIVFKCISVLGAIVNSYIWNKYWSFEKKNADNLKQEFTQFLIISSIGLLLNVGITAFVVNIIGAPTGFSEKAWANVGGLTASVLVLTWNFVGYKFFVFKK